MKKTSILDDTLLRNAEVLDKVIDRMKACHAFERSLNQHKLLMP